MEPTPPRFVRLPSRCSRASGGRTPGVSLRRELSPSGSSGKICYPLSICMAEDRRENRRGRPSLQEVLRTLDAEITLLDDHLGGLPRAVEAGHCLRQIWIDDLHNSTAIEGNTMSRAQVENLVERRQTSPASLMETLEVEGYARPPTGCTERPRLQKGSPRPWCRRSTKK